MIEFQNEKFRVEMTAEMPAKINAHFFIYMIDSDPASCAWGFVKYDGQIDLRTNMRICNTTTIQDFCDILKQISARAIEELKD